MKKFTVDEVKDGLEHCRRNDCENCPFEFMPMIDCEISLLNLALESIIQLETLIKIEKGRRRKK